MPMNIYQKTFDAVLCFMRKQRTLSVKETGQICTYRGPNGTKCAIGCLIPDELYDEVIEGAAVFNTKDPGGKKLQDILSQLGFTTNHIPFLNEMQRAHDMCKSSNFMAEFEKNMSQVAERYGLVYNKEE